MVCLVAEDPQEKTADPRDGENIKDFISSISNKVGPNASGVPAMSASTGGMTRLLRFYAADYRGDFNNLNLSDSSSMPTGMLNDVKKIKPYAVEKAAETLAKSVVIPCLARLDPEYGDLPLDKTIGMEPQPMDCVIVMGMIQWDVQ